MKPTVGRIVHYYSSKNTAPLPAIVTKVLDDFGTVNLVVFGTLIAPAEEMFSVIFSVEDLNSKRWCWPPALTSGKEE